MRNRLNAPWTAMLLAACCSGLAAQSLDYRVLAQGEGQQAVSGRLWLYGGGWGLLERVELGRIEAGDVRLAARLPAAWTARAYYAYLLALETDDGLWYRSVMRQAVREPESLMTQSVFARELPAMIAELGSLQTLGNGARTLVLPEQRPRRITLLHEDGRPVAGEEIDVEIFVWRQNHCGIAVGLGSPTYSSGVLGVHRTDEYGSFSLWAPDAALVLRRAHYPIVDSGEGAVLRQASDAVEIEPGGDVTIQSMWESPQSGDSPRVRLLSPEGELIEGWYAAWDMNTKTCGPPIRISGPSDDDGRIRVDADAGAELTRALTIFDSDPRGGGPWDRRQVHELSREELLRFVRDGSITLMLAKPAR